MFLLVIRGNKKTFGVKKRERVKEKGMRVNVKRKTIEDKHHHKKTFKVDEIFNGENSRDSYFQVKGMMPTENPTEEVHLTSIFIFYFYDYF